MAIGFGKIRGGFNRCKSIPQVCNLRDAFRKTRRYFNLDWYILFCHCQTVQLSAFGVLLAVDAGTFLILGKGFPGRLFIPVDFPASGTFAAVGTLGDEPLHILGRVAQKQADFMGKGLFCPELTGKLLDAVLTAFRFIAVTAKQLGCRIPGKITAKFAGAVEVNQRFGLGKPQRQKPEPFFHQLPVETSNSCEKILAIVIGTCKDAAGFQTRQSGGAAAN